MSQEMNVIHNGADDNASGVALMLSLAHELSAKNRGVNYLFLASSGHEVRLFGSAHFFAKSNKYRKKSGYCFNFDMVGRMQNKQIYIDGTENLMNSLLAEQRPELLFKKSTFDRINNLDSKWFYQFGISSLTFSTGRHLDYHRVTNDIEYVNFEGMERLDDALFEWIVQLK